jgi:Fe-S-cluster containining protein
MSACTTCTTCGACCASFRVDFSRDASEAGGGDVPAGPASSIIEHSWRMRGTDHNPPRCSALYGKTGEKAVYGICEWHPSPRREFEEGSPVCAQARRRHGLPALHP